MTAAISTKIVTSEVFAVRWESGEFHLDYWAPLTRLSPAAGHGFRGVNPTGEHPPLVFAGSWIPLWGGALALISGTKLADEDMKIAR